MVVETKRDDDACKRQTVKHWLRSGRNGTQIAKDLGMSYPSLKGWKRRYGGEAARCAALGVSRPGYYRWKEAEPGVRVRADAQLTEVIRAVHGEHRGVYGRPRMLRALRVCGPPPRS